MKLPLITLLLLVSLNGIFAQKTDTVFVSVSRDSGMLEKNKFINRYDDVFGIHVPSKWLFKWNVAGVLPQSVTNYTRISIPTSSSLDFSVERKVGPGFSINASYSYDFGWSKTFFYSINGKPLSSFLARHEFAIEPRWYFGMKNRIQQGHGASNFSGNYVGLELRHGRRQNARELYLPKTEFNAATLRFGLQRRVFKYGYFDVSAGLGAYHAPATSTTIERTAMLSEARIGVGLALARPKSSVEKSPDYCNALQCFREERRMWKVDLYNLIRIQTINNIETKLNVGLEQKLGSSPFSVDLSTELGGQTFNDKMYDDVLNQFTWSGKFQVQGRYYYNLRKRIAKGKSGNNLSGAYLAFQSHIAYSRSNLKTDFDNIVSESVGKKTQYKNGIVWGIQYRIFERAFIDFSTGLGVGTSWQETNVENGAAQKVKYENEFRVLSNLKIGLAF